MMTWMLLMTACLAAQAAGPPDAPPEGWRFVLPAPGDPFEHPPLRALGLGPVKPEDVVEKVTYRGRRQRYGQLRYGSPNSIRVTVVLDEVGPGVADLYVDADRNRRIEPEDRVEATGDGRTWQLPLVVAIVEGETTWTEPRAAVFRLGATGLILSHAAAGYLEGTVRLGDRQHAARRTDGDGNGQFTDAQDRLWIDLDDDGRFNPVAEQFPYAAILGLGNGRYAVRSDPFGASLALDPLEGTGTVRLAPVRPQGGAAVVALMATVIGREGSVVGLVGDGASATVPVGAYRFGAVSLTLSDPDGGPSWSYVFTDIGRRGEPIWHEVVADGEATLDPIGALDFQAGLPAVLDPVRPGDGVEVQPRLYLGDGLLIATCYRGTPSASYTGDGPGAQIILEGPDGQPLDESRSGFA